MYLQMTKVNCNHIQLLSIHDFAQISDFNSTIRFSHLYMIRL